MANIMRLQKALSYAGIASRRASEQMIANARVEVNGELIIEQGKKVDIDSDTIKVDDVKINFDRNKVSLALNKPAGVESTMSVEIKNDSLSDLIDQKFKGVFPIGRLDKETTGLILFTNDGELAYRLAHPKYDIPKIYMALVDGEIGKKDLEKLYKGVELEDGLSKFDSVQKVGTNGEKTILRIKIHSGKNRIIRRTFEAIDFDVLELSRVQFGTIKLGEMKLGKSRVLSDAEVSSLEKAVGL
ncbi:MAG: rRNA pseudouridine synthase [Bifidobacteriaceae bacterium]|jgi:23S rRNA pseudouridine2605 synthase|nr:rRNA pseudouridine synthase [Bifidobacteriaceae bacterium]